MWLSALSFSLSSFCDSGFESSKGGGSGSSLGWVREWESLLFSLRDSIQRAKVTLSVVIFENSVVSRISFSSRSTHEGGG